MVVGFGPVLVAWFGSLLHAGHAEHASNSGIDPLLLVFLGGILVVVFAFYLLARRTALAFREGANRGRR